MILEFVGKRKKGKEERVLKSEFSKEFFVFLRINNFILITITISIRR